MIALLTTIVTLSTSAQTRISYILVTYEGSQTGPTTTVIQPIDDMALQVGETSDFSVSTNSDATISVVPDNTNYVTVSGSGTDWTVTAVAAGTATITATSEDGGFKATCKVNVTSLMKAGVYWLQDDMNYKDGKSLGIKTYINPCIDLDGAIYYTGIGISVELNGNKKDQRRKSRRDAQKRPRESREERGGAEPTQRFPRPGRRHGNEYENDARSRS